MGLASALSTALTGLAAAETQIDVIGNNLANSQTVGFKESEAFFATQFVQTQGLGASPTADNGGVNPRQIGLGVQVAEIQSNFLQGTIELSGSSSDLAIQGDGFFMIQGSTGERLYTRNGIFRTNAQNELVSVTGNRLLGFATDDNFNLVTTQLQPIDIPIGTASVAQATQTVFLEGTLTPTGDLADTAEVIEAGTLGDASVPRPDASAALINNAPFPDETGTTLAGVAGGTLTATGTYEYRFAFADPNTGTEGIASGIRTLTLAGAEQTARLTNIPASPGAPPEYTQVNIYRREVGVETDFHFITQVAQGTASFDDTGLASGAVLDTTTINGNYSYLVTFHKSGEVESRPSLVIGPQNIVDGRLHLRNLPTPPVPGPTDNFPAYDQIRIYRNLATDSSSYFLVSTVNPGDSFTDSRTDADISDLTNPLNQQLDLDGPKIDPNTLLTNVLSRDDLTYENIFKEGTLEFTGKKGGRTLDTKELTITANSTVQDLINFMEEAMGVQVAADDPQNPVPGSVNNIQGESGTLAPGGTINSGRIRFVSNNGVDNALDVALSAFRLTDTQGNVTSPLLGFNSIQAAAGQSAVSDFLVFDSLGVGLNVRVTSVLQSRSGTETTYRWFADSSDNDPAAGVQTNIGTGLVTFDGFGNLLSVSNSTFSIERRNIPSASPLDVDLDFSNVTGLSQDSPSLNATSQDGFPTGKLASFSIAEDGIIRGSFTNGATRTLGQVRLARFTNAAGLEQRGLNQFAEAANSGLPIEGDPNEEGMGSLVSGALELSNSDIGQNLVDLVLATTMYRGNTRVITTSQQLLDELLNIRR